MNLNPMSKNLLKASFVGTFAETMLLPVWAVLTDKVGGSVLDAGIGYAIFCILTGIVVILVGRAAWYEKHIKCMVFWGFVITGLAELSYLAVSNKYELFLVQSVVGISVGILNPAWDTLYTASIGDEDNGKRWSFWNGGVSFVTGVAAIVGGLIVIYCGWYWLFIGMAAFDLWAIYYAYLVWQDSAEEQAE